jgi:Predicted membrane protein (DUF2142)
VSRRGGTRNPPRARAKAPAEQLDGRDAKQARQVGARAFTRRARAAERRRAARRTHASAGTSRLSRYLGVLLAAPYRELLRRVPRAAWICALVACANAVGWSLLTPAFQVPDEPDHFAYVKQLAETGSLPSSGSEQLSGEQTAALEALHYEHVRQQPQTRALASAGEQRRLELALAAAPRERGSPAAGVAVSQPPLYYALEAIPYSLAAHDTVLARLQLMRLLSALFAGLTALFAFLFVREALPAAPWSWTVGGLAIALTPLLGFMSGAVNPDSLLFALAAAVFYLLARAFRRGLSVGGGAAIGVVTALGLLTKLNFVGMVPGILLGLVVLGVRAARSSRRAAARALALAVAIALSPALVYVCVNALSARAPLGAVSGAIDGVHGSLFAQASYVWQLYLPRLPGMADDFPGLFTTRQVWLNGYIGLYGWLDTSFPGWVYSAALLPVAAIALLCARSLLQARAALRARAGELAVYALIGVGLLALVGAASYHVFPAVDAEFGQARYMLPLLALLAGVLVLAARGAGRRWGPVAGTLIVVLFLAHDVFSQLLVVARYYG